MSKIIVVHCYPFINMPGNIVSPMLRGFNLNNFINYIMIAAEKKRSDKILRAEALRMTFGGEDG